VAYSLAWINEYFRPLVDPENKNSWFAMDIEFKFIGPNRQLVVKQARPYFALDGLVVEHAAHAAGVEGELA
jgi:hypothetical protein